VGVGAETEVPDGLTGVLGSTENQGVGTSGGTEGQLVEGDGLTTGSKDASTGGSGEAEGSDGDLGEGEHAVVVGDGADNNDGALLILGGVANNAGERNRRTVNLGHKQAAEDDLVEVGVGTTSQEAVKLHQELEVDIVTLGSTPVSVLHVVAVEIDTCK